MAQRTGADGLLASVAKAASTRVCLVLAVAVALALGGCGGGSDGESSSTAASAASEAGSAQEAGKGKEAPEGGGQANAKAKQGPGVAPPKGPPEKGPTPSEEAQATEADISLTSPSMGSSALEGVASIPATYTCDGKDTWPELKWSGVPAGTEELVLLVLNMQPVDQALFFDWALAGIDPATEGIEEGKLPPGAILGKNGFGKAGYSICPPEEAETYVFSLYALPRALSPAKGFDPLALREQALAQAGNVGILIASYSRD